MSVKQHARIVWASLVSSLEVSRYDCLPHRFTLTFQPPLFKLNKTRVITCNLFKLFRLRLLFHDFTLAGNTRRLFLIFPVYNSVISGVTAYNVDVFKKKREIIPLISFPHHRNQFQTSIRFSL